MIPITTGSWWIGTPTGYLTVEKVCIKGADSNLSYTLTVTQTKGRDDIRALKILRPEQKPDAAEYVLFGTAYADLKLVRLDLDGRRTEVQTYDTKRRAVGSLSISSEQNPLIAATLGDSTLGLYPVDLHAAEDQSALSEVTPTVMSSNVTRLWSCNFIADDKVSNTAAHIPHIPEGRSWPIPLSLSDTRNATSLLNSSAIFANLESLY